MNTDLILPVNLPHTRELTLLLTADAARTNMVELIAAQILQGPLFVISGSNWLPAFELTRRIRGQTVQVRETLHHLYNARASTCYRLLDVLAGLRPQGEPVLVLDFLHTFYDADVVLRTRLFKLRECCRELKRLSLQRSVFIMTQAIPNEEYQKFLPALMSVTDRTIKLEPEREIVQQPILF